MRARSRVTQDPRLCGAAPQWHEDGSTRPAEVEPLHSVWGLSLEAICVLPQAARLSHPLAHGLASLTVMRGLSAARRCSAAGCAALRRLYVRCRRSAPLCAALRPSATDCSRLRSTALLLLRLSNLPRYSAADCGQLRCSCAALGCGREAAIDCTAASPTTALLRHRHASAAPPRHLASPSATAAPPRAAAVPAPRCCAT